MPGRGGAATRDLNVRRGPPTIGAGREDEALGMVLAGARVRHVLDDGPAARAGLRAGDVVRRVGEIRFFDSGDGRVGTLLREHERPVRLVVARPRENSDPDPAEAVMVTGRAIRAAFATPSRPARRLAVSIGDKLCLDGDEFPLPEPGAVLTVELLDEEAALNREKDAAAAHARRGETLASLLFPFETFSPEWIRLNEVGL